MKFIPVFSVNCASAPHLLQRIISFVFSEPQVKYFVPMIKNIILYNFDSAVDLYKSEFFKYFVTDFFG